jgi:flagellar basal-body rod protein FlgC
MTVAGGRRMNAMSIARSGLAADMMRLAASAANVANADSVGSTKATGAGADGRSAYAPVDVAQAPIAGGGVTATYSRRQPASTPRYDPGSTSADGDGLVAAPNVDLIDERVGQLEAGIAFGADLAALRGANAMSRTAIDLLA